MRPDKSGNYDGAMDHPSRAEDFDRFPPPIREIYEHYYNRARELRAQGLTAREILHYDPEHWERES